MLSNPQLEATMLGAALLSTNALVALLDCQSPQRLFASPDNAMVMARIQAMQRDNIPVDLGSLCIEVSKGLLPEAAAKKRAELVALVDACVTPNNFAYYIRELQECATRRQLQEVARQINKEAGELEVPLDTVAASASRLLSTALDATQEKPATFLDSMSSTLNGIHSRMSGDSQPGLRSGFKSLDAILTGGFSPGDLILIAGRPGMCKTAFAVDVGWRAAEAGGVVVMYSLEMSQDSLNQRLLSNWTGIPHWKIQTGRLSDGEFAEVAEAAEARKAVKFFVFDKTSATPASFLSRCRRIKAEEGALSLGIVDYIQLMDLETGNKNDNQNNKVGNGSRQLKRGAVELGVPLFVLSQVNRSCEMREDKRPMPRDLRDSGSLEQDADKILFMYREGYYNQAFPAGETEVIVAKHRAGGLGVAELNCRMDTLRFEEATT